MDDLISVIIPVYNAEKYLEECIFSVLGQENVTTELLLIDDGSTDDSPSICDDFKQKYDNVVVFHTDNQGVSHARNIGLDHAKGKYITFLDSDDELRPDALRSLLEWIKEDNADISVGTKISVSLSGRRTEMRFPNRYELWTGEEGLRHSLQDHPAAYSAWGKLYDSETLKSIRFREGRKKHEDSFFFFECLLNLPTVTVRDQPVILYNISENSASRSPFSDSFLDILFFAEEKERLISERFPELAPLTENTTLKAHMALLNNLSKTFEKKYRAQEKLSIAYVRKHRDAFIPASENDIKLFRAINSGSYYPRKIIKAVIGGFSK